ncbi:MAG: S8 family serine peptidase [Patescibacteria group bacterium]|nr:S8 family serine peptidase [Patescibacteria group bacterium]
MKEKIFKGFFRRNFFLVLFTSFFVFCPDPKHSFAWEAGDLDLFNKEKETNGITASDSYLEQAVRRWQKERQPDSGETEKPTVEAKQPVLLEFQPGVLRGEVVPSLPVVRTAVGEDRNKEIWLVYGGRAAEVVAQLSSDPRVKCIFQPDFFRVYPLAIGNYLNDPLIPIQWGLEQTGFEPALNYLGQVQHSFSPVTLIVVDDGVWGDHQDLSGLVSQRVYCSVYGCLTEDTLYVSSHGTHVAGIAAALTNNALGVASANLQRAVEIISVRIFSLFEDSVPGLLQAIDYVYNNYSNRSGVVVNISLGACYDSPDIPQDQKQELMQFEQDQYNRLWSAGMLTVAAAGNSGSEPDGSCYVANNKSYPAGYTNVISVGSLDPEGNKSGFSQYGDWVDLAAPGGDQAPCESLLTEEEIDQWLNLGCSQQQEPNITPQCAELNQKIDDYLICLLVRGMISTIPPTTENNYRVNDYDSFEGTSMASPFVSGAAALIWSLNPSLTNDQVRGILFNTAEKIAGTGNFWRYGKVNIAQAVRAALEGNLPTSTPTPTRVPTATLSPTTRPTSTLTLAPTLSQTPTPVPTRIPTLSPTARPTPTPTRIPTATPTLRPVPTAIPSGVVPRDWCLQYCPGVTFVKGDANCDGQINDNDYQVWLNQFDRDIYLPGRINGLSDFDCDGEVTLSDFELWRRNGER